MKSIIPISENAKKLAVSDMNKVMGGLMKVSSEGSFVRDGYRYTVKTLDRKHGFVTKMTVEKA